MLKKLLRWPYRKFRRFMQREMHKATADYRKKLREQIIHEVATGNEQLFYKLLQQTSSTSGVYAGPARDKRVIVSLTTIPDRLFEIGSTIESMLQQTFAPDEIVLWLDETKVSDANLPLNLVRLKQRGLRVAYCPDVGPHTKLFYALKEYPNDIVITVDDDNLYPLFLVEVLMRAYQEDPSAIICTRARHIPDKREGFSYLRDWVNLKPSSSGLNLLPLGVGGVLYPPHSLDEEVFNLEKMRELTPKADDIWWKAMSLRKGTVCRHVKCASVNFPQRPYSQEVNLFSSNVHGGQNEQQIKASFDYYDLWDALEPSDANS